MLGAMIRQTRNALIYSDLALLLVDGRKICKQENVEDQQELVKWLSERMPTTKEQKVLKGELDRLVKRTSNKQNYYYELNKAQEQLKQGASHVPLELTADLPEALRARFEFNKIEYEQDIASLKILQQKERNLNPSDITLPPILLVANKCEQEFDVTPLYDQITPIWKHINSELFFISGEHGDGLPQLFEEIKKHIPQRKFQIYEDKKQKRLEKYENYKKQFKEELTEFQGEQAELILKMWEEEFDKLNPDPEDNSDFDSDNEINAVDTLTQPTKQVINISEKKAGGVKLSSQNRLKRKPIHITVVGRPNVGKSTLVNTLLKDNRVVVNDLPGTTRDSVTVEWIHRGRRINLVDTAGVRLKSSEKKRSALNEMIYEDVSRAIMKSHVAIVLIDSMCAFTTQDFMIMKEVLEKGKSLVIAANKWDLVDVKYRAKAVKWMEKQLNKNFGFTKEISMLYISARSGLRSAKVMDQVLRVYEKWNTRVSTNLLNKWLTAFKKVQPMPQINGMHLNMRFLSQISVRPPCFFFFVNRRKIINSRFERHIRASLIKEFGFEGVPVRILFRDSKIIFQKGEKNLSLETFKVMKRIQSHHKVKESPTKRKRQAGARFLYKPYKVKF